MQKTPTAKEFAILLQKSLLPEEAKLIILKKLPNLSQNKIIQIYEALLEEQDKIAKAKSELDSKIKFAELKFDQELAELEKKEQ